MEAGLSLLLAVVLISGAALWWLAGARIATGPLRRMLRVRTGIDRSVGDASLYLLTVRWIGGLGLIAAGGWALGHSLLLTTHQSPRMTTFYLGLLTAGICLVAASFGLWKAYPWWEAHNPVYRWMKAPGGAFLHRIVARDAKRRVQYWNKGRKLSAASRQRLEATERDRITAELRSSGTGFRLLQRLNFAMAPAIFGTMMVSVSVYRLFFI